MMGTWKKLIPALFLIPFVMGSAGYIISGNGVTDSFYASFALYFTNPVSDSYNIWIEMARWTAPLATATAVLSLFENVWKNILWWFHSLSGDSVAVCSDSDIQIAFGRKTKAVYPGCKINRTAKSHIILMNSDGESFKFYENHKEKLAGSSVYIGVREIDYGLLKEKPEVSFFDINGAISRMLWRQVKLWEKQKEKVSVVIWGRGYLAETVLCYGLLLNLYSAEQRITYHMIGNDSFRIKHPQLPLMNKDEVVFYSEKDSLSWEAIRKAEVLIIAEDVSAAVLQSLAVNGRGAQIYYYSRKSGDAGDCLQLTNLNPFGRDEDVYTDENIRQERLVEEAKRLNLKYAGKYNGETDWHKLNGFLKWSNISSADFIRVLEQLLKSNPEFDRDELAELEHIRWCRLHFLNYWTFGRPSGGREKDPEKRIHKCLCPYSELPPENRQKDRIAVEDALERLRPYTKEEEKK